MVLTFRNAPHVDIVRLAPPSSSSAEKSGDPRSVQSASLESTRRHRFALAVHLAAVDRAGMFAAVAESAGCLKSWISIVNLNTRDSSAAAIGTSLRSKRRFGAHVGAVTGLQWTDTSSLLLSSGLDGFVKIWNATFPSASAPSSDGATLLAQFHIGESVLHMAYAHETSTLVTVAKAQRKAQSATIQTRALLPLKELEAFRGEQQLGDAAVRVQKVWKGHQTRVLLAELLGESHRRRRPSVGKPS